MPTKKKKKRKKKRKKKINFDLLSNADDSIRQTVELLAWEQDSGDRKAKHSRLKRAIMFSAHSIELLLKEKLRQANPAFVWENVDKYPSLDARTVTVDTAISRLNRICGVTLSSDDATTLRSLRSTRNAIEHYEWNTTEYEARLIIGAALSFAFSFAREQLNVDLTKQFQKDATWEQLLSELSEFHRAYKDRLETRLKAHGVFTVDCDRCGASTVTPGGSCELCGHWQDTYPSPMSV